MPLVNYSSSDDDEAAGSSQRKPVAKRQKISEPDAPANGHGEVVEAQQHSSMPPLPPAFHDLYAATVRQSTVDDPSLHQGRKRQVPHIAGHWPSHVYIEWRPNCDQHAALTRLLAKVEESLDGEIDLHQFTTSDLGAPLPLHVSLSRPLSLQTAEKDDFLSRISESLGSGSVKPFEIQPRNLAWFTSPDSNRSFLVLGVSTTGEEDPNQQLIELLQKSNTAAARFRQPLLYQSQDGDTARTAFHISIAWTFAKSSQDLSLVTLDLFQKLPLKEIMGWKIDVSSVKVKIGNAVTSIEFSGRGPGNDRTRFLFDES